MEDIYNKSKGLNYSEILNNIARLGDEIKDEQSKEDGEYDKQKEFELRYAQFIAGLKLNTGIKIF